MVLELPTAFAVRDAEHFALGGVEIFTRLGFVTHLSFGAENDELAVMQQAARLLASEKALGIKIHSVCHGYSILEYGDAIFSFANDHQATVVMHPDRIADMVAFADKYPQMRLIIAHLDDEEHVEAMAAAKHRNIYTDTSGGASVANNALEYAVETVGADRIFFGTDSYAVPFQKGRILLSSISEEDKQKILLGNALRCFPKLDAWLNRQKKLPY